jgi:restriction system protein
MPPNIRFACHPVLGILSQFVLGVGMYFIDLKHEGLKKFRRVSGSDLYVVQQRAQAQTELWNEQWRKRCEIDQKRTEQQKLLEALESKKAKAARLTTEAQDQINNLGTILAVSLRQKNAFDWETLYDRQSFPEKPPNRPVSPRTLLEPSVSDSAFVPKNDLFSWLIPSVRRRRADESQRKFNEAHSQWKSEVDADKRQYESATALHRDSFAAWGRRRAAYEEEKNAKNTKIDEFRQRYRDKNREAVTEFVDSALSQSKYDDLFPKQWRMDFVAESGVLIIDYELPPLDAFPTLKAVKYVQTRDALDESFLRESEVAQLYDSAMYQTCLRNLHEIFETDEADAIKSVTFNGWVNFIDKSNGKPARSCIMSVQSTKEAFQLINLSAVDPKACFRALKGVGSSKLSGMSAVVPILRLNKADDRFIPAHDVIESVAEATNVAAISWEEFEFLVRDIFEKEFSQNGGEVKITRASRDHGVDAIAFDPDPIRGGKIVIQAKRYTNLVGVSAVRDLYGTLINEGANRGILVTTSQYGPDSYDFAKDKPITLLDGGNLLSLLEKHGHKARIDLVEAKRLGNAREQR